MANAIAEMLQSATNCNATIIAYSQIPSYWQEKISHAILADPQSIYLVMPNTIEALAAVIKIAHKDRWNVIPCGSGSKLDWGGLTKETKLIVSTQKCDRIMEHAVEDLTVTVEAGIKLTDLQAKLKEANQFLPIDPAFPETATVGGILATADTGSLRQRYGGIRDLVLGISFIRGDGEIAKAGGRVVKNVAGYDLMKLFIGSYGTLGVISQVTFRTYPIPEASQTLTITGEAEQIAQVINLLKNSSLTPTAMDLVTASVANKLGITKNFTLLIRFQTIKESIAAQFLQLKDMVQHLAINIVTYDGEREQILWQELTNIVRIPQTLAAIICKLGIVPTEALALLQQAIKIDSNSYGVIHLGSGVGTLQIAVSESAAIKNIRTFCHQNNGFLSILSAPLEIKKNIDIWGYDGNALEMMKTIKNKFDPHKIFNCDRYLV